MGPQQQRHGDGQAGEASEVRAAQHIIDQNLFDKLHIPARVVPLIQAAWEQEPPSLYGRFDLAYDGMGPPKMLEYNADTPTSLVETYLSTKNRSTDPTSHTATAAGTSGAL